MAIRDKPKIVELFHAWFVANKHRFGTTIRVLNLFHRRDGHEIRVSVNGLSPNIQITVGKTRICALVIWRGHVWDLILNLDLAESQDNNGYFCLLCENKSPRYPTIEAMWAEHIFEEFLAWVNETLVRTKYLVIQGERGRATFAKLSEYASTGNSKPEGGMRWESWTGIVLPLWQGKREK